MREKKRVSNVFKLGSSFTLTELLVVTATIAVLAVMVLPALVKAKEFSPKEACAENLKKLGAAFAMYAADYDNWLPAYRDRDNVCVMQLVTPYLKMDEGLKGTALPYFGVHYLRCPVRSPNDTGDNFATYGVNYPYVFGYVPDYPNIQGQYGSPKFHRIPASVFVTADAHGTGAVIYHPTSAWELKLDTDGDGVKDSFSADSLYINNGLKPVHDDGANFLFTGGNVEWKSLKSWAANENNIWGTPKYEEYR